MGLLILLLLGSATLLLLWRVCGLSGGALRILAAVLLMGALGYAAQGRPSLRGQPAPPPVDKAMPDSVFATERGKLLERFGSDAQILDAADAMHRSGYDAYAVGLIKGALEKRPQSSELWIGLGNALTLYAGTNVTPAAELAFARAAQLAPGNPAPAYFRGLAYLQSGQPDRTMQIWLDLVQKAPADAPWRAEIAFKLIRLRQMMDSVARGEMPGPPAAPAR